MKVKRANSVCSDSEGPSSPDSVMSTGELDVGLASPLPSPQPGSPAPSEDTGFSGDHGACDQRLYSPSYIASPCHSPAYSTSSQSSGEGDACPGSASPPHNYPYSPKHKKRSNSPSHKDTFQFPPTGKPSHGGGPGGYGDLDDTFGCQADFAAAVRTGDLRELKRILTHYSQLIQINGFTADGQTALTQSCMDGNLEVIKVLLAHGASSHLTNRDGFSPLHLACWQGKYDIMTYLLRSGSTSNRR